MKKINWFKFGISFGLLNLVLGLIGEQITPGFSFNYLFAVILFTVATANVRETTNG